MRLMTMCGCGCVGASCHDMADRFAVQMSVAFGIRDCTNNGKYDRFFIFVGNWLWNSQCDWTEWL